ncbi:MAG: ABC transporter substrate-binding protein [Deltaproteobacteria bacterium]|nr:ABC transporter substrate-binding protein [Deltaproteobacteria bacterium]
MDECQSDAQCAAAFGLGSACDDGYCTEPQACQTGHDCRRGVGSGACIAGVCTAAFPADPSCPVTEPEDLSSEPLSGPDAPLVLGGIFSLDEEFDQAQTKAARLAIREINASGGAIDGRKLALVLCDNGGAGNKAEGTERERLNQHALDYLSGTLGVPALVGPLTSSDALVLIPYTLKQRYPTVIVSPSATSPALTDEPDRLDGAGDKHGLFWRTAPSDELQGEVLAKDVIGLQEKISKVAVLFIQDAYGQGLAKVFQESYGPDKTTTFPFDEKTDRKSLAEQVEKHEKGPFDAVLIIAVLASDTVSILTEMAGTSLAAKPLFFSDGSKDASKLLDPKLPDAVKDMIRGAIGTAPAGPPLDPKDARYVPFDQFDTALKKDFKISAKDYSFLAHSYDAGYVISYGVLYASQFGNSFDGRNVAEGMSRLSKGQDVDVGRTGWSTAKKGLTGPDPKEINIQGCSGPLDFDPATGEAPGPIEIWRVKDDLSGFEVTKTINPK